MRTALLLLTLSLSAIGCRRTTTTFSSTTATAPDTLITGMVIRSAGSWSAHTAKTSQKLDVTVSGNSVSWSVETEEKLPGGGTGGGSGSSGMNLSSPSDPWLIFVESPQRFWFFNGKDELTYSLSGSGGSRGGPAMISGKLLPTDEKIPMDIVPLLPADLQKLFPPIEPKTERPSF